MQKNTRVISEKEALQKLGALCSRSEHCSFEMLEKMKHWGIDEQAQARIMEALVKGKYVDDERFARAYANDKVRYDKWGKRKVEQGLFMKRIGEDIRERVLSEIEEDDFKNALMPLLAAKMKSVKAKNDYELSCKLIRFALGRGFGMEEIRQCLEELVKGGCDDLD